MLAALAVALPAQSPQHLVVPAAYTNDDAISYQWIAGASRDVRQQTLIGPAHLTSLIGHTLHAIELRRTAKDEMYLGGSAGMTVTLSTSPKDPLSTSPVFANNVGVDAVQVFTGDVTLPNSPSAPGPVVGWTTDNTVRIEFQVPFVYLGGTLCVDVIGNRKLGQEANWWMADAEFENLATSAVDLGGGCGDYGGANKQWSHVAKRTLVAGGQALFFAYGPPGNLGLVAFGPKFPAGIPMTALGFASLPECELVVSPILLDLAFFEPEADPGIASRGGRAEVRLSFPNDPSFLAITFTTQWFELQNWWTSNAIEWTTAATAPQIGMALVEGDPSESTGEVSPHLAHVMRFEYL
jgi:hypothetical protein